MLIIRRTGEADRVVLTEFDFRPRNVELPDGTETTGYRLRPGAVVSQDALGKIAANLDQAEKILDDDLGAWSELDDAILALTEP
ncbi:AraC family transcriptional regulator, partial [Rhizobiaceae sp. 2RAB30]